VHGGRRLNVVQVGTEHADMVVGCLPGIKTEHLQRVTENRNVGSLELVIIHVGTNDLRTTRNLDFLMGEVYALVAIHITHLGVLVICLVVFTVFCVVCMVVLQCLIYVYFILIYFFATSVRATATG
jgi:hypothetical protein